MAGQETGDRLRRSVRRLAARLRGGDVEPAVPAPLPEPRPVLSVVVVARDAMDPGPCLDRLREQSVERLEVLVVTDDHSGPATAQLARRVAGEDTRFRVIDGSGLTTGDARNHGASEATGEFLAFLTAAEVPAENGYPDLLESLARTGADFAAGGWLQLERGRPRRPVWAAATHDRDRPDQRLSDFPDAVLDLALANRVFRAEFWRQSVGRFASGEHTELEAVLAATLRADRFDYRKRQVVVAHHPRGPARSATLTLPDLEARLTALESAVALARAEAAPEISGRVTGRLIDTELGDLVARVAEAGPVHQQPVHSAAGRLLALADEPVWPYVRVERKIRLWHAAHGQWVEVIRSMEHFRLAGAIPPTEVAEEDNGPPHVRLVPALLPEPLPGAAPLPATSLSLSELETGLTGCIERLRWTGSRLEIDGWTFIRGIDLADITPEITAQLISLDDGTVAPVDVALVERPAANRWARLRHHDVAPSGFTLGIDTAALPAHPGRWQLRLVVRARGVKRAGPLTATVATGAAGRGSVRPLLTAADPVRVIAAVDREHGFCVQVRAEAVRAVRLTTEPGSASGRLQVIDPDLPPLVAVLALGPAGKIRAPLDAELAFTLPVAGPTGLPTTWQLRALDDQGRRHRVSWPLDVDGHDAVGSVGGPTWVRSARAFCELVDGATGAAVDVSVTGDAVTVEVTGNDGWSGVRLVGPQVSVPAERIEPVVPGRVRIRFLTRASRWGGPVLPLPTGGYRLVRTDGQPVGVARPLLDRLPVEVLTSGHLAAIGRTGTPTELSVALTGPYAEVERSAYGRERISSAYQQADTTPTDSVLFQCYRGEFATDSQRAVHDELHRRGSDLELLWGVHDYSVPIPAGGRALLIESAEWFAALAASRYLCRNIDFERYFRKRSYQRYLQTFHGYPFKSMGASLWRTQGRAEAVIEAEQSRRNTAWDAILVPADFCIDYYRREYAYDGPALVTGYPRNDPLLAPDPLTTRSRVLGQLGIPLDKTVVLYAPTWRDTGATSTWTAPLFDALDLVDLAGRLGDDYAVLLRGHNYNLREGSAGELPGIFEVSAYPEVNDLILAADVAVLDYSSLRFDWLITRKPVLFFVPDLEDYLATRSVLFDFEESAPGPLLRTTEAVAAALLDLDGVAAEYAAARMMFNERFNMLHDGHASERVVDAFFS